ncbi:lysozyme inhibitor LprI family protein [Pluralibacter gergoviae]|uniref:Lysozyme inhibitor LprI family protein n=2 Tax=Pluralibacter gergoviae TaxID=61647 RepID=A0AAW8HUB7_PLUGE|nr:lysozyme inhibitor LprI family protein [Pluralibacter gergoviae]AVR04457.1 DUF1311 domain-containing protein [Pluralibacter gergoviae]KMK01405.1 hypothetical protein ABW08_23595 [Pluralibacter gergoviae]KMK21094.1 hypothetical protein ABW11_24525 [Pluralibacter gergoviae]MDQ2310829.1 lysozyme inhibitor LprI family protein [Pluralibacter gergoviae]HDS1115660.1 DUF1311 domain-containing protein [Pluralibacter gergoviae]
MNLIKKLILFLIVSPLSSYAALQNYSTIESECRKENDEINNSVVMGCAELASSAAKKDMNITYQKIFKIIESRDLPEVAKSFELAQKSWLALRENWCDVQGFIIGTPMYSVCRMDMNISRVNELNDFLEQIQE